MSAQRVSRPRHIVERSCPRCAAAVFMAVLPEGPNRGSGWWEWCDACRYEAYCAVVADDQGGA